jgi:hypothetical protein
MRRLPRKQSVCHRSSAAGSPDAYPCAGVRLLRRVARTVAAGRRIAREGSFNDTRYEEVARKAERLGFDNITLVKGYFDRTLSRYSNESFGLVHLDVDLFESYRTCLEFFYPRMVPGGYIVCDEYDGLTYPGAKIAIDSFLTHKPERLETFEDLRNPRPFIRRQRAFSATTQG